MIALSPTEPKEFMSKLLRSDIFDPFLFIEGEIVTFGTFHMDGFLKKDFFEEGCMPERDYMLWKDVREYCFSVIKGKRTPLRFQLIFGLSESNIEKLLIGQELPYTLQDVKGLYLNIKYDEKGIQCTTGTSMNLFTMDKSLEHTWDTMVQKFFTQKEIPFKIL